MSNQSRSGAPGRRNLRSTQPAQATVASEPTAPDLPPMPTPGDSLFARCEYILNALELMDLSFGELVTAVCYGETTLRTSELAVEARGSMYKPERLSSFLETCYLPPRPPSNTGPRPVGGSKIIRQFIFTKARETFAAELKAFSEDYNITKDELVDIDFVSTITSESLYRKVRSKCPELSAILSALTSSRPTVEEGVEVEADEEDDECEGPKLPPPKKHPNFVSTWFFQRISLLTHVQDLVFQVASMAYRINPRCNMLQKILTVYMKAKHTAKAVFEILQQAGITMSYWWIKHAISSLSVDLRNQAILAAHTKPILLVHDNIRLKYGVSSQRGDNQSISDNGTASTLIILPESGRAFEDPDDFGPFYCQLKAQRIAGTAPKLSWKDIDSSPRRLFCRQSSIHDIIDHFRLIPALSNAKFWKYDKLLRPTGPQQLPHGQEHRLKQYMLPTTNIDESSYSGNSQVVAFILRELKLDSEPQRSRLMLERKILWPGDQVTAQRCRQVQNYRQESINAIVRWDPFIFFFGGLHLLMALAQSIVDRYRGSNTGPSFGSNIIQLSRTGLEKTLGGKRLDFHTMDEFLLQSAESHFTQLFSLVSGCKTEEEISAWADTHTAEHLFKLASNTLRHHASPTAMDLDDSNDEVRQLVIMRQQDLLLYYSIQCAYMHGDVDQIEALLPELLCYFIGSGNGNYAKEVFEFLQLITHECTPTLHVAILKHGLVVNKLGRADSFYPIDQRQEFNNAVMT
ncbi:hypothetical protein FRC12_000516 [Ceratobasidium sp. 428]|nr:hypothetical protein FRC12_000516 [Ceratobasidium sp. 428]